MEFIVLAALLPCFTAGAMTAALPLPCGPEETLHFDGAVAGGMAVTGEYEYWAGVRYTPVKPCSLRAVTFYQYDASAEDGWVRIYGQGTTRKPGTQLAIAAYAAAGTQRWKRVDLTQPVALDSGVDFWSVVTTTYYTGDNPLGVDAGPIVNLHGGYIKVPLMGETWYQLSDAPFYANRNWNQRAIVISASGVEEEQGPAGPNRAAPCATIVTHGVLRLPVSPFTLRSSLFSLSGEKVLDLKPGANDVSRLAPGVYFMHSTLVNRQSEIARVVVTR